MNKDCFESIFILDIPRKEDDVKVKLTGRVLIKRHFNNSSYGIKIRDITGSIWCNTDKKELYESIQKKDRINLFGCIKTNSKNNRVINIEDVIILETRDTEFSLLDSEMQEQYAKMLMTRIIKATSTLLEESGYVGFDSKLISRYLPENNSLEPLLVKYSGFGTPACLTISPSAQIIEFLEMTLLKCFTISTSFTQSYRLPNTSSELKVIMAKSLNLTEDGQKKIMINIAKKIYSEITNADKGFILREYTGSWPDKIENEPHTEKKLDGDINLICFKSEIPVIGKHWNSTIERIFHIIDKERNILIEGAYERMSRETTICTITIYPSQFLHLIKKAPARQIKNLEKLFYGKNS